MIKTHEYGPWPDLAGKDILCAKDKLQLFLAKLCEEVTPTFCAVALTWKSLATYNLLAWEKRFREGCDLSFGPRERVSSFDR